MSVPYTVTRAPRLTYFSDYWDSYWITQGLIKSELYDTVKSTLENFMDELKNFGFIPNGGRTYCACPMLCPNLSTLT